MIQFIIATFAILAAAFWFMSGGSDFEPEARPEPVAVIRPAAPEPAAEVVRDAPEEAPQPAPSEPAPTAPSPAGASAASFAAPVVSDGAGGVTAPEQPAPEAEAPAAEPAAPAQPEESAPPASRYGGEVRLVDANRVNLRSGPSTDYRVLDTLIRDTRVEILAIDELGEEPWAELLVLDTGLEGFMALRFLKPE